MRCENKLVKLFPNYSNNLKRLVSIHNILIPAAIRSIQTLVNINVHAQKPRSALPLYPRICLSTPPSYMYIFY